MNSTLRRWAFRAVVVVIAGLLLGMASPRQFCCVQLPAAAQIVAPSSTFIQVEHVSLVTAEVGIPVKNRAVQMSRDNAFKNIEVESYIY